MERSYQLERGSRRVLLECKTRRQAPDLGIYAFNVYLKGNTLIACSWPEGVGIRVEGRIDPKSCLSLRSIDIEGGKCFNYTAIGRSMSNPRGLDSLEVGRSTRHRTSHLTMSCPRPHPYPGQLNTLTEFSERSGLHRTPCIVPFLARLG